VKSKENDKNKSNNKKKEKREFQLFIIKI